MAKHLLTDKQLRGAQARPRPYVLRDGESLYAVVKSRAAGGVSISFQYYFKWEGRLQRMSLGAYPKLTLAEARRRRDLARAELNADPPSHPARAATARREQQRAQALVDANEKTVQTLFEDWERIYLIKHRKDKGARCRALFEADVFPLVGALRARHLRPHHVTMIVERPLARGARRTANMLLSVMKQCFSQAVVRGFMDVNPAASFTRQHAGGKQPARERALSVEELRDLGAKLRSAGLAAPQQAAIRLLLATGARVGELNKATWTEFDLDADLWRIPAEHTKEARAHVVHLSEFAKAQLAILAAHRTSDYVLTSARNGTPIEDKQLSKTVRDRQREVPLKNRTKTHAGALRLAGGDWRIHDLRRTMATRMGDLGVHPHVSKSASRIRWPASWPCTTARSICRSARPRSKRGARSWNVCSRATHPTWLNWQSGGREHQSVQRSQGRT